MSFQPDGVLFEKVLAETLGISRTPVLEALQQLALEELVVIAAHSGTFVTPAFHACISRAARPPRPYSSRGWHGHQSTACAT
jgi:DNA-binding GntR family transcriptional regulator